jgi:hypothetical protein
LRKNESDKKDEGQSCQYLLSNFRCLGTESHATSTGFTNLAADIKKTLKNIHVLKLKFVHFHIFTIAG